MQLGHHHLGSRDLLAIDVHSVHGNAATVVDDGNGVVQVNGDFDLVSMTCERFVHRVVHHFVDQMVQSHLTGGTYIHRGTFADGFHAAEDCDGVGVVVAVASGYSRKLSVFILCFVDGSNFFRSHSAPWKGPGVGLSRRPFRCPGICLKLLKLLTLTASEVVLYCTTNMAIFRPPNRAGKPCIFRRFCSNWNECGDSPRLSGGAKLRMLLDRKNLSSFARLDSRGRLSPRVWVAAPAGRPRLHCQRTGWARPVSILGGDSSKA